MKELFWDFGTTYDLFVSLNVLNRPLSFGLRPSWAAGVRSRLPLPQRQFMESLSGYFSPPLKWIHDLPSEAKNAAEAVRYINLLPSADLLELLAMPDAVSDQVRQTLIDISESHTASLTQRAFLQRNYSPHEVLSEDVRNRMVQAWQNPANFGEEFKLMLSAYYESFFAEEEQRILPVLKKAYETGREQANQLPLDELLEKLSHGVKLEKVFTQPNVVLVPSYWASPLIIYNAISSDQVVMLFGCRPSDQTIIPGEPVPDQILNVLKALADPTRLQMLRYLNAEPLTVTALSHKLRLRPPTVTHHLHQLRLAGLIKVEIEPQGERKYTLRGEAFFNTQTLLQNYIDGK